MSFESAPPINAEDQEKKDAMPEPLEPKPNDQKKDSSTEGLVAEANKIERELSRGEERLREIRKELKSKEFLSTPEGKKWTLQLESEKEAQLQNNAALIAKIEFEILEARRALALQIFADELIKKYRITRDDPRLDSIVYSQREVREGIAALHYKHDHYGRQ